MSSIFLTFLSILLCLGSSQLTAVSGSLTYTLSLNTSLNVIQNALSPSTDTLLNFEIGIKYLYLLSSSNQIQVHSREDPSIRLSINSQYAPVGNNSYIFRLLSVDPLESTVVVTSHSGSKLNYLLFWVQSNASLTWWKTIQKTNIFSAPKKVINKGTLIIAYFSSTTSTLNDTVLITNTTTDSMKLITLNVSGCSVEISPNKQHFVVWNKYSQVYVHRADQNFTLKWIFNDSITSLTHFTETVHFSANSELAIIQTGSQRPINVINLTSLTVYASVPNNFGIKNVLFLDSGSRFLFVQSSSSVCFYYDLQASPINLVSFLGTLPSINIYADPEKGYLYCLETSGLTTFGATIVDGNVTLAIPGGLYTSVNVTNATNPGGASGSNENSNQNAQFYVYLNYTSFQDASLHYIAIVLDFLDSILQQVFSFIFSTPFASFFLSIFNFFTFSSIYILLPIRSPHIVFQYLQKIFRSCQTNLIEQMNIVDKMKPFSEEKVTEARALYFNIGSDLLSQNYFDFGVVILNIVLVQVLIFVCGTRCLDFTKLKAFLVRERMYIYWGLIVSNMVQLILPWKFVMQGGAHTPQTKINSAVSHLLYMVLLFLVALSFVVELRAAKKSKFKKNCIKVAIRKWWTSYENLVYPMLVLLENPIFFFLVIGLSQCLYLYNSLTVPFLKGFAILKAIYPMVMHASFAVFLIADDQMILSMTAIVCLSVFLLGAFHNLLEGFVRLLRSIYKIIKSACYQEESLTGDRMQRNITISNKKGQSQNLLKEPRNEVKTIGLRELIDKASQDIQNNSKIKNNKPSSLKNPRKTRGKAGKEQDDTKKLPEKRLRFDEAIREFKEYQGLQQNSVNEPSIKQLKKANEIVHKMIKNEIDIYMRQFQMDHTNYNERRKVKFTKDKQVNKNLKIVQGSTKNDI